MTCNCWGDSVPASPGFSSFSCAALCGWPAHGEGCAGTRSLYWSNLSDNQAPLFGLPTAEPSRAGGPCVAFAFPVRSSRNRKARSIELAPSLSKICPQCFAWRESAGAEEGLGTRCLAPALLLTSGLRQKMSASRGSAAYWDSELRLEPPVTGRSSKPSRVRKSSSPSPSPCKRISLKTASSCSLATSSSKFAAEVKGLSVRGARPPAGAEAGREAPVELARPCLLRNFCLHGSGFKPTHSTEPIPGVPVAGASFGTRCG